MALTNCLIILVFFIVLNEANSFSTKNHLTAHYNSVNDQNTTNIEIQMSKKSTVAKFRISSETSAKVTFSDPYSGKRDNDSIVGTSPSDKISNLSRTTNLMPNTKNNTIRLTTSVVTRTTRSNKIVTKHLGIKTTNLFTGKSSQHSIKQIESTTQMPSNSKSQLTTPEYMAIIVGSILGISILIGGLLSLSKHLIARKEMQRNLLT